MIIALLVVAACQSAPVQEMSDARQAITVAREAGAANHAADQLEAAVTYLENAERHLTARRYADARREAEQAKLNALDALQRSETTKQDTP
jgi:hypothetical protein